MPIIKYQLVNGRKPDYITSGGHYPVGNDLIGIGSGGGTEMTKSELLAWVLAIHERTPFEEPTFSTRYRSTIAKMTAAEVITEVNNWCTARGIS